MRSLPAALLILLAACIAAPASAQVKGSYELVRINGDPLPAASPTEDVVIMEGLTVLLGADARYTFQFRGRNAATDAPVEMKVTGTYEVAENRLLLTPDEGTGADPVEFRWELRDGELLWWDENEDEYTLARR